MNAAPDSDEPRIERLRRVAFGAAYRMLGSAVEADDVAQEALLRLHGADAEIADEAAYVTTVATRIAIDVLRSARVRRETYPGEWLPEPLVEDLAPRQVEDEETLSLAFVALLERLTPEERAVLVLREAFDFDFGEIAPVVGKSEANCRQILSRARRRVGDERPRFDPDPEQRRALVARFVAAAQEGDVDGLVELLAPGAVLVGDGGGKAPASPRPIVGGALVALAVSRFFARVARWGVTVEPALVNGQPGLVGYAPDGAIVGVSTFVVTDGRIERMLSVANPDKLAHLGPVSTLGLLPRHR